jgi:hypothetical protein
MAITFVQAGTVVSAPSTGPMAMTTSGSVTVANVLFAVICWDANDSPVVPSVISDNLGNTYALVKSFVNTIAGDGNLVALATYATTITTGGTPTTTITMTGRGGGVLVEYSGITSTLDQFTTGQATTGASVTTGTTGTTSTAHELILLNVGSLGAGSGGTNTASGYTSRVQGGIAVSGRMSVFDQMASSTGTFTATVAGMATSGFNGVLLTTLPATGGPPPTAVQAVFLIL